MSFADPPAPTAAVATTSSSGLLQYATTFPDFPAGLELPAPGDAQATRGGWLGIVVIATSGVTVVLVLARVMVRRLYKPRSLWLDDYMMVLAALAALGFFATQMLLICSGGVGSHQYSLPLETQRRALQLQVANEATYLVAGWMIKASILVSCLPIVPATALTHRRVITGTVGAVTAIQILSLILVLCACSPGEAVFDVTARLSTFKCLDIAWLVIGLSIAWTVTNIWTLVIPVYILWPFRDQRRKTIGVGIVLLLGVLACGLSGVKIAFVRGAVNSYDATWRLPEFMLCNQLEIFLALVAASLAGLGPLFLWLFPASNPDILQGGFIFNQADTANWASREKVRISSVPTLAVRSSVGTGLAGLQMPVAAVTKSGSKHKSLTLPRRASGPALSQLLSGSGEPSGLNRQLSRNTWRSERLSTCSARVPRRTSKPLSSRLWLHSATLATLSASHSILSSYQASEATETQQDQLCLWSAGYTEEDEDDADADDEDGDWQSPARTWTDWAIGELPRAPQDDETASESSIELVIQRPGDTVFSHETPSVYSGDLGGLWR